MKTKVLTTSMLMVAAISASSSAFATGLVDTWFETQLKGTIPHPIRWDKTTPANSKLQPLIKFDTGKQTCYTHIIATLGYNKTEDNNNHPEYQYDANTFCKVTNKWEIVNVSHLHDLTGGLVAETDFEMKIPLNGSSYWDDNNSEAQIFLRKVDIVLIPKTDKNNVLKNVVFISRSEGGMEYESTINHFVEGDNKLGAFTFKFVKALSKLPTGVADCALAFESHNSITPGDPNDHCDWNVCNGQPGSENSLCLPL